MIIRYKKNFFYNYLKSKKVLLLNWLYSINIIKIYDSSSRSCVLIAVKCRAEATGPSFFILSSIISDLKKLENFPSTFLAKPKTTLYRNNSSTKRDRSNRAYKQKNLLKELNVMPFLLLR